MRTAAVFLCAILYLPLFSHAEEIAATETVDIIIEAQTFVPPWYDGRAEPSPGEQVRAVAVAEGDGDRIYRWAVNGTALPDTGAIANFSAPLGNEFRIRVDVLQGGATVASNERAVRVSEPEVAFYESSLLRGTLHNAIRDEYALVGEEVSVRAVPYFMARDIFSGAHQTEWKLQGRAVEGGGNIHDVITLRNEGGTGTFGVEFAARNARSLTQHVHDAFRITF